MATLEGRLNIDGMQIQALNDPQNFDPALPTLVLLNGLATSVDHWGEFPQHLEVPAVAIDATRSTQLGRNPYFPFLSFLPSIPSLHPYANQVARGITEITEGGGQVDLGGYSFGGILAQLVALKYPELIRRQVLIATAPFAQCGSPEMLALIGFGNHDRSSERFLQKAGDMYGGDLRTHPELVSSRGIARETNIFSYWHQVGAVIMSSLEGNFFRVHNIEQPTLVIASDDDPLLPKENAYMLEKLLPNVILEMIEGGGHAFVMTRPEETAMIVNPFLLKSLNNEKLALVA